MRRLLAALTLLGAGTLLAACGGGGVPASPTALTTAPPLTATPGAPPTTSASASAPSAAASASPTSAPTLAPATATPGTVAPTSPPATAAPATPTPPPPPPPAVSSVTVTAENLAFDRAVIRVKAGSTLTATLINKDTGVDHNLAFSLPGLEHETCAGPCTTSQTFTTANAGRFLFFCNLHATMFGDFIVE